jgi:hypothetical protein
MSGKCGHEKTAAVVGLRAAIPPSFRYDPGGTKKESTASLPAMNVNDFATRWQTALHEICAIPPS